MAALTPAILGSWIESLENIDWLNFRSHGLNALRFIHTIPIRPEILHAAARFWDPELHVFRFGIQELCPTVEEFQIYLGSRACTEPVVPPFRDSLTKILKNKLGVNESTAKYLLRGNALDILRLFADFRPCGDLTDFTLQNRRMFALCMCLLASYLLVPLDGNASPSIVSVALQIEQRRDVVPMVLAETLMGLDAICSGRTNVFGGSPLLLQMWLCDKVKLKADPENHWVYDPRTWNNRPFVEEHGDRDGWTDFLMILGEEHVIWRCHWLVLPDMTAAHMGSAWVVVAGLTGFAFYFPQRILRQLGIRQEVQFSVPTSFHLPEFKHSVMENYRRSWKNRVTWVHDDYPTIHLEALYRKWIRAEVSARFGTA